MRFRVTLSLFALTFAASTADAGVPATLPVQGFLTDELGVPIDGNTPILVRLYHAPTGDVSDAWFEETQSVPVIDGELTMYIGGAETLDMTAFRDGPTYLGITLPGEPEMTPRLPLGSVPYAAYAQETAAVPPGSVMFFDLDECPPGWASLDDARGRAIVGMIDGGTRGGTVGAAFGDLENRGHSHTVDPAAVGTSTDGAHAHVVDPAAVTSTSVDLYHTHSYNPAPFTTALGGDHAHQWSSFSTNTGWWRSFDSSGAEYTFYDYNDDGMDHGGSGAFPLQTPFNPAATTALHTNRTQHQHSIDVPGDSTGAPSSQMNHAHSVNIPETASSETGAHAHTCDVGETTSSSASATTPYLQLLVCRKQ